ncbi:MAG TPA: PD-(D/E)XK nuclease family protein [Kofleriaceae bacterium]
MTTIREIPHLGGLRRISSLSVSQADQLSLCALRLLLASDIGLRQMIPANSPALLGTAAHNALAGMARATRRDRMSRTDSTRLIAQSMFDEALAALCGQRDAEIQRRGPLPGESTEAPSRLPFYGLARARFTRFARARFGEVWAWPEPELPRREAERSNVTELRSGRNSEVSLSDTDPLFRGIADVIDVGSVSAIEEFKTGELDAERLPGWTLQLLLYGYLCERKFGVRPSTLRVISLHGAEHEFGYQPELAEAEAQRIRDGVAAINDRVLAGAGHVELAQPSAEACAHCAHRPWCDAFWLSKREPGTTDGVVTKLDGWKVTLESNGLSTVIDFKWHGSLPAAGQRLRILGVRTQADANSVDRTSAVWSVP